MKDSELLFMKKIDTQISYWSKRRAELARYRIPRFLHHPAYQGTKGAVFSRARHPSAGSGAYCRLFPPTRILSRIATSADAVHNLQ
ncbi:Ankyrin repeat domain-containing protein 17 [Fusarium oxysporum f. sp. albedinis]|nr:Ankyrin repeat domain-containing protein 17 [Fusarium oxysporum f. sp. albedinis]